MHSFPTMASTERPQASSADSGLFNGAIAPEPISLFLSGDVMTARGIDQAYNPPPTHTHTKRIILTKRWTSELQPLERS